MDDPFDPFDLPSSFDPLGRESLEPTGQSAYLRRDPAPPNRRRADSSAPPATAAAPPERAVNPRLAHLLPPAEPALRPRPDRPPGHAPPDETAAHLLALEDEVSILTARLDGLEATLTARQEEQQLRIVQAVAALIDTRLGRWG